jgi:hypothetical protein
MIKQATNYICIVLRPRSAFGDKHSVLQTQLLRCGNARSIGHIRDHDRNLDALEPSGANRFCNGVEV